MVAERVKRVLFVEDDLDTARLVRAYLHEAAAFDVTHVTTLASAIEHLEDRHFDAIVTDLQLPDSAARHTFRTLHEKCPELPMVVLTGTMDEHFGRRALRQGAQDFLFKDEFNLRFLHRSIQYAIERQRLKAKLLELALRDPLTGLYNRRGLAALAEHQLTIARRESRMLVVVAVDVDSLKRINDKYGHEEGDRALVRTARVLRKTFRAPDIIGRVGGDEFVAIALIATRRDDAIVELRGRLDAHLRRANLAADAIYPLSLSFGIASLVPRAATAVGEVLQTADRAMYEHKSRRRREPRAAFSGGARHSR